MGFWSLFEVASMPILEVLLLTAIGALMATQYFNNILTSDTRKSLNKIVFVAFTPSLIFASLAKTVTLEDIISWWFMPINIGITFLCGGMFGWIATKIIRPKPHMEGLLIAMCSTGNLGNILLIIVPAICTQGGSPFGEHTICKSKGLSYSSFSMALGSFYIWTYTYQLLKSSSLRYTAMKEIEDSTQEPNKDSDENGKSQEYIDVVVPLSYSTSDDTQIEPVNTLHQGLLSKDEKEGRSFSRKLKDIVHSVLEELMAPPTLGSIVGLVFGATPWLKNLVIGDDAPLRVIQDSITLLGDGTIPCITLILGGNLVQGLRRASIKPVIIITMICVRYIILPMVGILVVKAATNLGILPADPLFSFVLLIQYTVPPAMNISTMAQLFNVGQEECSVLTMWSYLAAAFALTGWSTVFMWILT